MSTDFENELRDLFREKAVEAPLATPTMPASAPQQVLRRGRLHQAGTVIGSAVVVVALILGSVAGLTRILGDGGDGRHIGDGGYQVFQRTARVEAFTVTSPSDWTLVNHWPLSLRSPSAASDLCPEGNPNEEVDCVAPSNPVDLDPAFGLPMLQLANEDIGLASTTCGQELGAKRATLYIALDHESDAANVYPPDLADPGERELPLQGDGPCGPGRYANFSVSGQPFFAWIGLGTGVTDQDLAIVTSAFESMIVHNSWQPTLLRETSPGYVIAGDSDQGENWRLELRPGDPRPELTLERSDGDPVSSTLEDVLSGSSYDPDLTDPIFGAVVKAATGVEFRPGGENDTLDLGQSPVAGTIVPIPPTMGAFDFDLFFIDPPADYAAFGGHVIALGVHVPSISPSPAAEADVVELSGVYEGATWRVAFTGAFADQSACIEPLIDGDVFGQTCPEPLASTLARDLPYLGSWSGTFFLRAGSVPIEVVEIRFVNDDDAIVPTDFQCEIGPSGWTDPDVKVCVQLLPMSGSGTVEYVDAAGNVVSDEGIAWGSGTAEPERPVPVDPVHGGTYWAVYAWIGAQGSREADDVSARLLEEFGIEASPGDLACDDGAAEALGTDAEQGIGLYFEAEDEANAFALEAGLLGHEGAPVIARVTTYCLD